MTLFTRKYLRAIPALVVSISLSGCLDVEQGGTPEPELQGEAAAEAAPNQVAPATPAQPAPAEVAPEQPADEVAPEPNNPDNAQGENEPETDEVEPEEMQPEAEDDVDIEPELKASIPDVISAHHQERLEAQYSQTIEACQEIRTVCIEGDNEEVKCEQIAQGCMEAAESFRAGHTTRAGLLGVLKSLVEAVLGVGDAATSLVRCVARLVGCTLSTLSLFCVADLVECVVGDVIEI